MNWTLPRISMEDSRAAVKRQQVLTKPTGALGLLEDLVIATAGVQGSEFPLSRPAAALIFAADQPVAQLGVSAYPIEVTAAMVLNLVGGGAAASVLSRSQGIPLSVWDVGVLTPYNKPDSTTDTRYFRTEPIGEVGNLRDSDGLDNVAFDAAWAAGELAVDRLPAGTRWLLLGEMGIGNTTPATAVASALLAQPANELVGKGTGLDLEGMLIKTTTIQAALDRVGAHLPAKEYLRRLGGRDLVALVSAIGRAAEHGMSILIDGLIVSVAAMVACRLQPEVRAFLCFSHLSEEPAHQMVLADMKAKPLVHASMRLGEASGALVAFPLVESAMRLHAQMATFTEAAVPDKTV